MFGQQSKQSVEFAAVLQLLERHRRRFYHTRKFTLNRLFRKNLAGAYSDLPVLTPANTSVSMETRLKLEWAPMANMARTTAYDSPGPIIVFRFRDTERLLDGNNRCRYWLQTQDQGSHEAVVLTIKG